MITDALKEALRLIPSKYEIGEPLFTDTRYAAVPFDSANFTPIDAGEADGMTLCFIDGGNMPLLGAPNFSLQLVRIYFNLFRDGRRVAPRTLPQKIEFLSKATAQYENNDIVYAAECLPLSGTDRSHLPDPIAISSTDSSIALENIRADIGTIGQLMRKFAEWHYAAQVIAMELGDGDVLVRDGTLQTTVAGESVYAHKVYDVAERNNTLVTGLAKTSTLFTTTGVPLVAAVQKLAETHGVSGTWCYNPLVHNTHPDHRADISICKFRPESRYAFRFEVLREQAAALDARQKNALYAALARNAGDLSFIGYPYGLINADANARVTSSEAATLRAVMVGELSKSDGWGDVAAMIAATDAHDILNRL